MKNENPKEIHKFQTLGMSLGMCFGISIGMSIGGFAFDNMSIGMCIGMSVGMLLGMSLGISKDKLVNKQVQEKGYTILEINPSEANTKECIVTLIDKDEQTKELVLTKNDMKFQDFEIGDLVYLNDNDTIEQLTEKMQKKNKSKKD